MSFEREEEIVHTHHIACDGGAVGGHPRVWLELGADKRAECPYCGKLFIQAEKTPPPKG